MPAGNFHWICRYHSGINTLILGPKVQLTRQHYCLQCYAVQCRVMVSVWAANDPFGCGNVMLHSESDLQARLMSVFRAEL